MKQIVFVLTIMFLYSCNSKQNQEKQKEDKLSSAIENAQKSPIVETKLFLDFRFGMTEIEVESHLDSLLKIGKIFIDDSHKYKYEFTHESGLKYNLGFSPQYYDGRLYEMYYPIQSSVSSYDDLGYTVLFHSFMENKSDFKRFITKDSFGDPVYTNIKDNLIVIFEKTVKPFMIYENAPISKIAKEESDRIKKEKSKNSSSEF